MKQCPNCGAPISATAIRCAYCDTRIKRGNREAESWAPGELIIETKIEIPYEHMTQANPARLKDYVINALADGIKEEIKEYIDIKSADDYISNKKVFRGRIHITDRRH